MNSIIMNWEIEHVILYTYATLTFVTSISYFSTFKELPQCLRILLQNEAKRGP